MEPSIRQQISDHQGQREKLAAFFRANPFVIYSQETLADAAGCHVSCVRTRIGELRRGDFGPAMSLVSHVQSYRDEQHVWHRGMKRWECLERPAEPLGRDAGTQIPSGLLLGVEWAQR